MGHAEHCGYLVDKLGGFMGKAYQWLVGILMESVMQFVAYTTL